MLHAEILAHDADILCLQVISLFICIDMASTSSLQEVDSLDKLLPALDAAQYNHHYVAGPGECLSH
jgi:RNA exonuclease NGL2